MAGNNFENHIDKSGSPFGELTFEPKEADNVGYGIAFFNHFRYRNTAVCGLLAPIVGDSTDKVGGSSNFSLGAEFIVIFGNRRNFGFLNFGNFTLLLALHKPL